MSEIIIKDRRFWRKRADGSLVQLTAPRSRGLASPTFASTGANKKRKG